MTLRKAIILTLATFVAITLTLGFTESRTQKPFGEKSDVAYAKKLWSALGKADLVGKDRINVQPFVGNEPHGAIQQVFSRQLKVDGKTATVLVKVNHGGKGIDPKAVYSNPNKYLGAYTVMFKRGGYDSENQDWFWVKFTPDGGVAKNPMGAQLAGRVPTCIACHKGLGGDDLQVLTSR